MCLSDLSVVVSLGYLLRKLETVAEGGQDGRERFGSTWPKDFQDLLP